jgi:hypothetical protein
MCLFVFITSVGIWLGTVVCVTQLVVPLIRATLHPEAALELLHKLFPRFYTFGVLCGMTALAAIALAPSNPLTVSRRLLLMLPVSFSLLCTVLAQYYIYPRMSELHGRPPDEHDHLLRFSTLLNNTVLLMLVFAFATFATR